MIFHPNFPEVVYYKNGSRRVPINTFLGVVPTDYFNSFQPYSSINFENNSTEVRGNEASSVSSTESSPEIISKNPYNSFNEDTSNPLGYEAFLHYRETNNEHIVTYRDTVKIRVVGTPIINKTTDIKKNYTSWQAYFDSIRSTPFEELPKLIQYVIDKSR